jgi:putative ABC transport system permease protein
MEPTAFLESLTQDLRYGVRGFARNPMFTLTAVFAAALGIGASTAVFSAVDRILFRSLPYPGEDRLVSAGMMAPLDTSEFLFAGAYLDWRRQQTPFESITSFTAGVADCDLTENNPARLGCASVEANFLPTLGLSPFLGRNFTEREDRPNGPKVALISYALWQGRFARDPGIVGKSISIDAQPVIIIGVLPPDFEMPTLANADLVVPQALNETNRQSTRALRVFARLKPGVTIAQAQAAMQPLFDRMLESVPAAFRKEVHLRIRSLRDRQVQDARLASCVLLFAVGAVLLIACANIANLLLARSTSRRKEMAVRAALGAGRWRLIRQTLTETTLLGMVGGALGYALAWVLLRLFIRIAPSGIPRLDQAALDGRVLLFALATSLISGLVFGLAPAIHTPTVESMAGWRRTGGRRMLLREVLVAGQIAVSVVLLTGGGMLLRSLWNLQNVSLGLNAEHVVTADFILGKQRYSEDVRQLQFFDDLESRLRSIPGATAFTISDSLPPYGGVRARPFVAIQVEGQPPFQAGTGGMVVWRYVTPGYFDTLGIRIGRGRGFEDRDRGAGESTIVLSNSLARKLFASGDALGRRLNIDGQGSMVIGIAADVRNNGPAGETSPEYYMLRKPTLDTTFRNQMPPNGWRQAKVAVRTSMNSSVMAGWLKKEIAEIDAALPVTVSTMQQRVSRLNDRPRFNAVLLALFAAMGLVLADIGLYGVMAFLVGQRTQEIGVRMALGATPRVITRLILSHAAVWTLGGAVVGLIGSLFATRAVRSLLFEVPEHDPWTLGMVLPGLLLAALTAAWIPSVRAARVDPMTALRHE